MVKESSDSAKITKETIGNSATPKDATLAGSIALRAVAREEKFCRY
ncbi:variable large family protein [Borrelia venezuelensis]|nr:variable large family protein [Borrelia venezuelensis]UPA12762.1 variable large family protein [Borrelia venezuelensis]